MVRRFLYLAAAFVAMASPGTAFSPPPTVSRLSSMTVAVRRHSALASRHRAPRLHPLHMAGAGGKAVTLDEAGFNNFDQAGVGDADPIGSIEALNKVVPRAKITELIKQTSDAAGLQQVLKTFVLQYVRQFDVLQYRIYKRTYPARAG
jgi:hypothetical protein